MQPEEKIIRIDRIEDLPNLQELQSMQRGLRLKVVFDNDIANKQQEIGNRWKEQLPKFLVGIHSNGDEINLLKLITDEEIEQNQLFFEDCAIKYGLLSKKLIERFIEVFNVPPHKGFPLNTLNPYGKTSYTQSGKMEEWKYYFHGYHCAFTHKQTGQRIEVPLTFGEEYGELDPYFFSIFIRTTSEFQPLPVQIYNDFWDGRRILEVMLELGKFETINSNLKGRKGVVVKNRLKREVRVFDDGKFLRGLNFKVKN